MVKIFVQNVGAYVGSNLSKRFAEKELEEDEPKPVVVGTLSPGSMKPRWVAEVVESTPEAMKAAFMDCQLTVLDCLGSMAEAEALLGAISTCGELPEEKTLIGVSSVMTWNRTSVDPEEPEKPLTEEEYKRRRPHSNFKDLLALEKLVVKTKLPGLRTHVVAAGLTYGLENDLFHTLFKAAWGNAPLPLLTITDAANLLPCIHVTDLCSVLMKLATDSGAPPYMIAVDAGQQQETAPTLAAVTAALSKELGVDSVTPLPREEVLLVKDYEFFQAGIRLASAAASGIEWHCETGLLANMPAVVQEFRAARGLLPLRLLAHGNDDGTKSELCTTLAAEYKLPLVQVDAAVASAREGEGTLAEELKAVAEGTPVPDALVAKVLVAALNTTACKNQGYLLEGFPKNLEQAKMLFFTEPEEGEEAPPPPDEDAGPAAPTTAAAPELVLVVEASDETIKTKTAADASTTLTEEALLAKLAAYAADNAEDSPTSLLAHPALKGVEAVTYSSDAFKFDELIAKARIYMGAPRNYGPTDEELAAAKALADAEAAKKAAAEAAEKAKREAEELEMKKRREAHEGRRLAELQQQERELLEVRSIPLRNYLMQHVIPTLTEGLIEVCKLKPDDPVDHLAEWLFKNNPVEDDHFQ